MGDLVDNLSLGFSVALTFQNIGLAFLGCMVGTLVGMLPGIGPLAGISILLPLTFGLGRQAEVRSIEVMWPSGRVDRLAGEKAGQVLTIEEGRGIIARAKLQ